MRFRILSLCAVFFGSLACTSTQRSPEPALEVPESILLGEPLRASAHNLDPGETYTIINEVTGPSGRRWVATAEFESDPLGTIDLMFHPSLSGDYQGADPFGLLWAGHEVESTDIGTTDSKSFAELTLTIERDGERLAKSTLLQWHRPPSVTGQAWGQDIAAELFLPADTAADPIPAIVVLGGSGGGKNWAVRTAAVLAQSGFAVLALAYFNESGLPTHLAQVPIEPVLSALDQIKAHPRVNAEQLALVGYSKGAELALLVASWRADVSAVVGFAPGSAVFQGFKPPDYPVVSAWSKDGIDLPFVPNAYDRKFFETYDGMYLWYRTLSQHDAVARAAIPVEAIEGDILLISGVDDQIWPATYMSEQVVARLHIHDFKHEIKHLAFPNAGHGVAAPPGEPTRSVAARLGGTAAGNAAARREAWRAVVDFLDQSLDRDPEPSKTPLRQSNSSPAAQQ